MLLGVKDFDKKKESIPSLPSLLLRYSNESKQNLELLLHTAEVGNVWPWAVEGP